jgi:hypothetical protein
VAGYIGYVGREYLNIVKGEPPGLPQLPPLFAQTGC